MGSGKTYSLSCTYLLPRRMTTGEPFFKTLSSRRPSFGLAVETVKYSMDRYSVQKRTMSTGYPCEEWRDNRASFLIGDYLVNREIHLQLKFSRSSLVRGPSKNARFWGR